MGIINKIRVSRLALLATVAILFSGLCVPAFAEVSLPGIGQNEWDHMLLNAAEAGDLPAVQQLVEKAGANIEVTNESGETPLVIASRESINEMVKYLIEAGANVNPKSIYKHAALTRGVSSLHWAVRNNDYELVRLLVKARAKVNAKDIEGETPLHYAARAGLIDIVDYLVRYGHAKVDVKNILGQTPRDVALEAGCMKVVEYFDKGSVAQPKVKVEAEIKKGFASNGGKASAKSGNKKAK